MFGKESCSRCGKKMSKSDSFCPGCGQRLNTKRERNKDYGMLGKDDLFPEEERSPLDNLKLPFGLNTIFNSLMKNLDKQFNEINKEMLEEQKRLSSSSFPRANSIRINISSFGNFPPRISVSTSDENIKKNKQKENIIKQELAKTRNNFSEESMQKLLTLPRSEPKTNIKRISNKIIYEIDMPSVNSFDDVSIAQLENSIEIKAIGKNKIYSKLIPINLSITNHKFSKGKLILEFLARN